jgi:hypothetical protein
MDTMTRNKRPTVALVALPLVAVGAGVAIAAFHIAIAAVIAMILRVELLTDAGRLGDQVNRAIEEAIATGAAAVFDNVDFIDNLTSPSNAGEFRRRHGNV